MPEERWSAHAREHEALLRELGLPEDVCVVDLEQGCHAGRGDHPCACLHCVLSAAFEEED